MGASPSKSPPLVPYPCRATTSGVDDLALDVAAHRAVSVARMGRLIAKGRRRERGKEGRRREERLRTKVRADVSPICVAEQHRLQQRGRCTAIPAAADGKDSEVIDIETACALESELRCDCCTLRYHQRRRLISARALNRRARAVRDCCIAGLQAEQQEHLCARNKLVHFDHP